MSRIVRLKYNPQRAPARLVKRRGSDSSDSNSSIDISDDDEGYSAVDEISESDNDDDEHVFAAEEEHIISAVSHRGHAAPVRPHQGDGEDADKEENEDSDDEEDADDTVLQEGGASLDIDDNASWDGLSDGDAGAADFIPDQEEDVGQVERRVRFTGVPDSDSDDTTSDTSENVEDFFPDIFVEQSSLDPSFRREIEYDPDELSSEAGSFYDFYNSAQEPVGAESDDDEIIAPAAQEDPFNSHSSSVTPTASQMHTVFSTPMPSPTRSPSFENLDGYESDGDTTEEDIPEPLIRKKMPRQRFESLEASDESDTERPARTGHGQPRLGRYNLDHSDRKPIAVVNPHTRKMMIFTPSRLRRLDLAPESFNLDFFTNPGMIEEPPIMSNSASLMMGAMFSSNTFGDYIGGTQALGAPEAFFSLGSDAITADDDSEESGPDDEDEEEKNLKLEDFITFHQTDSDCEGEQDDQNDGNDWAGFGDIDPESAASTPARPRTSASAVSDASMMDVHPLLSHFDNNSNAVGAFRRNQINQQLILSDKASHESLAFSGPYHYGTLRGIKSGSMGTVTAPITPLRRQRKNSLKMINGNGPEVNRSPLENMSAKRKASAALSNDSLHKRHRSISDMEVLQI